MKEFFQKYGGRYEDPYEAIEMMCNRLYQIKDKVEQGDESHIQDLSELSNMIDDYVRSIQNYELKPMQKGAEYKNYEPQKGGAQNEYYPNRTVGFHYPNVYPLYPFFNEDERSGRGTRDYRTGGRDDYRYEDRGSRNENRYGPRDDYNRGYPNRPR